MSILYGCNQLKSLDLSNFIHQVLITWVEYLIDVNL